MWSIVTDFDARQVPTAMGAGWTTGRLTLMLQNPRIAGLRAHNGIVVAEGTWPGILERDTWERVRVALDGRTGARRRRFTARSYALVGYLFCTRCGGKLRSVQKQNGRRAYSCRKGPGLGGCGSLVTLAEPVEEEVKQYVVGKLCDPRYRKRLVRLAQSEDDEATSLADRLAEVEGQRDMLLDIYLEKKVTKPQYERRYGALTESIETLHRKVFSRGSNGVLRDLPPTVEQLSALWEEKGIGFQRQLIDLVIERIEVKPAEHTGRRPFDPGRLVWHPK
jgi:hypothetical protein